VETTLQIGIRSMMKLGLEQILEMLVTIQRYRPFEKLRTRICKRVIGNFFVWYEIWFSILKE